MDPRRRRTDGDPLSSFVFTFLVGDLETKETRAAIIKKTDVTVNGTNMGFAKGDGGRGCYHRHSTVRAGLKRFTIQDLTIPRGSEPTSLEGGPLDVLNGYRGPSIRAALDASVSHLDPTLTSILAIDLF